MCGILAVLEVDAEQSSELRKDVLSRSRRLRHRGPDWSGIHVQPRAILAHERLGIVDPESGHQPLIGDGGDRALTVNGEIYNHDALRASFPDYPFTTHSDCEVILALYGAKGDDCVHDLDGVFAFVLSDARTGDFLVARDPMGVVPLYFGTSGDGSLWFSSELKAIADGCERFEVFPPGHLWSSSSGGLARWYHPPWFDERVPTATLNLADLRGAFEEAVVKRMMADVPGGVLLSGGVDSSLGGSVATRHAARRVEDGSNAWWPRVHSFCIGLEGSPDLAAAQEVADFLGTVHHAFTFTIQDGLDALSDVIRHLETYDVTTIRASTPMYLMTRKIKALGIKMVLSGEGADEIFGGYLYFHKAPDAAAFHRENVDKLKTLHLYDCLRANKSTMAWGVEVRVPFLDRAFLDFALGFDPTLKLSGTHPDGPRIEKHILRAAFDDPDDPWLPASVLWRQKEQFSDGVGYGWIDALKDHAETVVSDQMLAHASLRFPHNTPPTKEAYMYRTLFQEHYPQVSAIESVPGGPSIACSTPTAIEWDDAFARLADPSGRAVAGIHNDAYGGEAGNRQSD